MFHLNCYTSLGPTEVYLGVPGRLNAEPYFYANLITETGFSRLGEIRGTCNGDRELLVQKSQFSQLAESDMLAALRQIQAQLKRQGWACFTSATETTFALCEQCKTKTTTFNIASTSEQPFYCCSCGARLKENK